MQVKTINKSFIKKILIILATLMIIFSICSVSSFAVQVQGTDGAGVSSSTDTKKKKDSDSGSSSSSSAYSSSSDTKAKTYSSGEDMAKDIFDSGKKFINEGSAESTINKKDIQDKLLPIANVIVYIATGVFLVVGSILGVRYMLAQDMQERAQIQKNLLWFVIAMAIVYGGVGIYNIVVRILNGLF